jgi:hypothetical protein
LRIFGTDDREMISISAIERDGADLVLKGRIFGTMPLTARIRPEEARAALKLLDWRMLLFLLSLPLRHRRRV